MGRIILLFFHRVVALIMASCSSTLRERFVILVMNKSSCLRNRTAHGVLGNLGSEVSKIFRIGKIVLLGFGIRCFQLCERAIRSRVALREEGQVELLGETPKQLGAARCCVPVPNSVKT